MSRANDVIALKLCLETLQATSSSLDLNQLESFIRLSSTQLLIDKFSTELQQAWDLYSLDPPTENLETVTKQDLPMIFDKPSWVSFKLPNATVGKSYASGLEIVTQKAITVTKIENLDDLGLCYRAEENLLTGDPLIAGDHSLIIHYVHQQQSYQQSIPFVINNNPRNLWKNIASDPQVNYWKADDDFQGLDGVYQWKLVAASKRGRSHAHVGGCRDDDFCLKVD
ncbi:MAG: hypothetical protein Q9M50_00720 [Methylococcales bacterium]|nr:hypothetical protein [Methylococcales bacterium]